MCGLWCELITNGHCNSMESGSCCACTKHAGARRLSVDLMCRNADGLFVNVKERHADVLFKVVTSVVLAERWDVMCTSSGEARLIPVFIPSE